MQVTITTFRGSTYVLNDVLGLNLLAYYTQDLDGYITVTAKEDSGVVETSYDTSTIETLQVNP